MRRHLLLILFSLSLFSFAQTNVYHPFPDSNAVWRETYYYNPCNCPNPCMNSCGYEAQYVLNGDTAIGSHVYHKVSMQSAVFSNGMQLPPGAPGFWAGIRQDTAARKVYCCIPSKSVADTLLYDFTLQVGDTLRGFLANFTTTLTVTSVDSVLVGSSYRKRIVLGPAIGGLAVNHEIIEGIGFTAGLFDNTYTAEEGGQLICFKQETQTLYPNSNCTSGFFGVSEFDVLNTVHVYPDPASDVINVEMKENEGSIYLLDALGITVLAEKVQGGKSGFDVSSLAAGIYWVVAKGQNGNYHHKVIVQH